MTRFYATLGAILITSLLSCSLIVSYWAFGLDNIPLLMLLESKWLQTIVAMAVLVIAFVLVFTLAYKLLRWNGYENTEKQEDDPAAIAQSHALCILNAKGVALTIAVILLLWSPFIIAFYPGVITWDGLNQLYQYSTPLPTWYTINGEYIDAEFIDHHPVFDSLIYGFFVYCLGGLAGSHNVGMFAFSIFQCVITAAAFGISICYLDRLGIRRTFRLASLAFVSLLPLFPITSVTMLKDATNAPFFLLFFLMFVEVARSEGNALKSSKFLISFIVVASACILTKKTGAFIVVPSCLIMLTAFRSTRTLFAATLSAAIPLLLFPTLVFPLLGGVTPGGRQEIFALFFQQTATVAIYAADDINSKERSAIDAVMNLDRAVERYDPSIADPAKNSFRAEATKGDLMQYFGVWAAQGLRHPDLYIKSVILCTGSLYAPIEGMTFYSNISEANIEKIQKEVASKNISFECKLHRPKSLTTLVSSITASWNNVSQLPISGFLLSKGLYGGWIPIFCLLIVLIRNPRRIWLFTPAVMSFLFLFVCPVDDTRYIFPLLYSTPLLIGLMLSSSMDTNVSNMCQIANGEIETDAKEI